MRRVLWILCGLLAGCTSTPDPLTPAELAPSATTVLILNEGLWGQSNASLTVFDPAARSIRQNAFTVANGRPLGDVGNFIAVRNGVAYLVMNGSDRVEIIEAETQKSRGTINLSAGRSPRQLAFVNDSLGLVTNLYDASVSVLNLRTLTEASRIPVGPHPEGIAVAAGTAFVANSGLGTGRSLSMIDLATLGHVGTIEVEDNPSDVVAIGGTIIAVLCAGSYGDFADPNDDTPATLVLIDAFQRQVTDRIPVGGHAFRLAADGQGRLYVPVAGSVLRVTMHSPTSITTFATGEFYGVGVDTTTGDVYLADAGTFTAPGEVRVFDASGNEQYRFPAGLIPGRFAVLRTQSR